MAAGDYIIPGAQAVTERGIGFINSCGEAALAVIQGLANGTPPTIAQVIALVKRGTQYGTAPSGTSTPQELANLSAATGTPLTIGSGTNALSTINANLAAGKPTEIGVNHAGWGFGGADSSVSGHYVTVVGRAASGSYIVADPNQPASLNGGFVQYTANQIIKADPFATLTPTNALNTSLGGATAQAISSGISTGLQGALDTLVGGVKTSLGVNGLSDFAWRAALIIAGMVLIVVGMIIFFGHQESQAANIVVQQTGNAAKAAGAAAAAA